MDARGNVYGDEGPSSAARYVEDVTVGAELPTRYRGPMVIGDIIAWLQGNESKVSMGTPGVGSAWKSAAGLCVRTGAGITLMER